MRNTDMFQNAYSHRETDDNLRIDGKTAADTIMQGTILEVLPWIFEANENFDYSWCTNITSWKNFLAHDKVSHLQSLKNLSPICKIKSDLHHWVSQKMYTKLIRHNLKLITFINNMQLFLASTQSTLKF